VADSLRTALQLDGSGRLLDVGCGPGSLTLLLAPMFGEATEVDADPGLVLPHPLPPRTAIAEPVRRYLDPTRRAGRGSLPDGTPADEDSVYRAAGFGGPDRLEVPGRVVTRAADDVVASVFSLSSSAPHLFGDKVTAFETELRQLLYDASPTGVFSEHLREIALDIWHP